MATELGSARESPAGDGGPEDGIDVIEGRTLSLDDLAASRGLDLVRGLDSEKASRRLAERGPNRLAETPPRSRWRLFADQFKSLLILILVAAAALGALVGDLKDVVVIGVVIVLNSVLGYHQEVRAEAALSALKRMLAARARVVRDGHQVEIDAAELVPGDLVLIEAGDRVPADGRLIDAHRLAVDESSLTGESVPTEKGAVARTVADRPLAERRHMAYMNTVVTRGRGRLLVTDTGMATETGRLAGMLRETPTETTPLQRQLDRLGERLALIAGVVVAVIFTLDMLSGEPLREAVFGAIIVAVAAIPEGLPAVVTVTLAVGMYRMAQRGAIIKRLAAVETLGSTSMICSDKTGTLTLNEMTARRVLVGGRRYDVTGLGYDAEGEIVRTDGADGSGALGHLLFALALCNDSRVENGRALGDPTEAALLVLASKGKVDRAAASRELPRITEIPFDPDAKFMATFHEDGERVRVCVKGAPDVVLGRCTGILDREGRDRPLDEAGRVRVQEENGRLAAAALRVLGVAVGEVPAASFRTGADLDALVGDLSFVGLVGLMDPPRQEAANAIALCRSAGIAVQMITGDQAPTAAAIASELGIPGSVLTGRELDELEHDQLAEQIDQVGVFARATPEHKVRIVSALKRRGHVVAMTGDGVNDAPALKAADIGVGMGRSGTEVSKEAATMVLTDDNFATIVKAVKEGRTLFANMVHFVRFQLSTNIGALLALAAAPILGLPEPFNPIQLLWINLIMDGPPAMALGLDPARPGIMDQRPRDPGAAILDRWRLRRVGQNGIVMAIGTLGVLAVGREVLSQETALTLAFTTFVLFQFFNAFNARAEHRSTFGPSFFTNWRLWAALATVLVLQVIAVHWPSAQEIFETTTLSAGQWAIAIAVASSVLIVEEVRKFAAGLGHRDVI